MKKQEGVAQDREHPKRFRRFIQVDTCSEVLNTKQQDMVILRKVIGITYQPTPSKKYPDKLNVLVRYRLNGPPFTVLVWLCLEYGGGARWHAEQFFARRGLRCPSTAIKAVRKLEKRGQIPAEVELDLSGEFSHIIAEHFAWQDLREERKA